MKKNNGFTLLELMVVVIIVGILSALGASQYNAAKEKAIDNEARANLRLILAAERMYRMENSVYIAAGSNAVVNANLRLALPVTNSNWDYAVVTCGANNFCARGVRSGGTMPRTWRICAPGAIPDPQPANPGGCAGCGC